MRTQLRAELRRLVLRKAVRWCTALVVLASVLLSLEAAAGSSRDLGAARNAAERKAADSRAAIEDSIERHCQGADRTIDEDPSTFDCALAERQLATISGAGAFVDPRFSVALEARGRMVRTGIAVAFVVLVLGMVVAGGDWVAGTVMTSLLWDPRRGRLFGIKLAAFSVVALAIVLVAFTASFAGDLLVGATVGTTAGVSPSFLMDQLAPVVLRSGIAVAALGAAGCALALAARSAIAPLLGLISYAGIGELGLRNVVAEIKPWLVFTNVQGFAEGSLRFFEPEADNRLRVLTGSRTGIYIGVVAALAVASTLLTARRDV